MGKVINPDSGRGYAFRDRSGLRNGRLVFTRFIRTDEHKHNVWEAVCDCGNITQTATPNKTRSCGCLRREVAANTQKAKKLPIDQKIESRRKSAAKQRAKRKTDPVRSMAARLSRLHRHALRQIEAIKKSPTFDSLGYSVCEFVAHIERQFSGGMGWNNMHEWQIDHIIPISTAKSIDDVIALNQLANLKPLWAKDNNKKKAQIHSLL